MKKHGGIVLFVLIAATGIVTRGSAQDADTPEKPKSAFETVIPNPTGLNGYEELVMAGDLVRNNEILNAVQQPDATLQDKRKALADPTLKRALELLRFGLSKPVISPRDPNKMNAATLFPEFSEFRNLARLLNVEIYVRLSDGNISGAMDSMNDGLRLGHVTQTDTLIAGLVGIAIDAISLKLLATHIPQLAFRDCDRLERLCAEWLAMPSPIVQVIEGERRFSRSTLHIKAPGPDEVLAMIDIPDYRNGEAESPGEKALRELLLKHPEDAGKVLREAAQEVDNQYRQMIEQAKLPAWQRTVSEPSKAAPEIAVLVEMYAPLSPQILDKYDQIAADFHLLGTFAALRRFQWLHDRLPDTLAELRDPEMTLDSYTGKPLLYQRTGATYDLHAAGPFTHEDAAHPFSGPRNPLYLPYRKPSPAP